MTRIGNHDIDVRLIRTPGVKPAATCTALDGTKWSMFHATALIVINGIKTVPMPIAAWVNDADPDDLAVTTSYLGIAVGEMSPRSVSRHQSDYHVIQQMRAEHQPRYRGWVFYSPEMIAYAYARRYLNERTPRFFGRKKNRQLPGQTVLDLDPSTWETAA